MPGALSSGISCVKGRLELPCIAEMFRISGGEPVRPVEIRTCAEIQISVGIGIENSLKSRFLRNHYRSRRKSGVHVGVVGRIYLKVTVQNSVHIESQQISNRRIGLKTHPYLETVEIHSGD